MFTFDEIAEIRFGLGLSPEHTPVSDPAAMVDRLMRFDNAAARWPIPNMAHTRPTLLYQQAVIRRGNLARREGDNEALALAEAERDQVLAAQQERRWENFRHTIIRNVLAEDGLRERLSLFWADHFTIRVRNSRTTHMIAAFTEDAIRPYLAGSFADLLWAAVTHPMMMSYLDQITSVGPNSRFGRRKGMGLNENLARELLELHTLGVDGNYTQTDVRQLAELLTGLTYAPARGMYYAPNRAEPGSETVLGRTYASYADLSVLREVVTDIAVHPDTARHIAQKLAVHFVADTPDEDLVAFMAERFAATDGNLAEVYAAMLDHPAAWSTQLQKVKQPFGFVTSALRALGVGEDALLSAPVSAFRRFAYQPMKVMGQNWEHPVGPDGWPEEAEAWITPQGMAGRINWAMVVPQQVIPKLPEPSDFVRVALGQTPPESVVSITRSEAPIADKIGIILASPEFQRR